MHILVLTLPRRCIGRVAGRRQLVGAVEEEPHRIKHWAGFPLPAARFCLEYGSATIPARRISRNLPIYGRSRACAHAAGDWSRVFSERKTPLEYPACGAARREGLAEAGRVRVHFIEHHRRICYSAFFDRRLRNRRTSPSTFRRLQQVMWGIGRGNQIEIQGCSTVSPLVGALLPRRFTHFSDSPSLAMIQDDGPLGLR